MRNGLIGLASVAALTWMMAANGCGGSSSSEGSGGTTGSGGSSGGTTGNGGSSGGTTGTAQGSGGATGKGGSSGGTTGKGGSSGGAPASGGSGGSTTPTSCPNGTTCGGNLVGTWKVSSSCLTLSGEMDGYLLYLGCPKVPVTGSLKVTGTWTANANGTFSDNTTTTGSMTFALSGSCLLVSSTPVECPKIAGVFTAAGWTSAKCETDGGGQCNCTTTADQKGGLGLVSPYAAETGSYKTSGGNLTIEDQPYSYCVSGDTLTVTPKSEVLPLAGTVVLTKGVTPGTGGAAGATSGSGGKTGSGGTTGSTGGATTGAGGTTTPAGGTTGSGGKGGGGGSTAATGGTTGAGGTTGGSTGKAPCDIYAAANSKCVAAHSTVRALFGSYTGKLYQVKRASDSKTQDISVGADGFADSAAQDTFCTGTTCVITFVYDQSGNGNDVEAETADSKVGGNKGQSASNASQEPFNASGHKVYSLYLKAAQAYWRDGSKTNVPLGASPQSVYMVTSGKHFGSGCCFDYGNGPISRSVSGCGTMDSVNFSSNTNWEKGAGAGPWVMADFECGLKAGGNPNSNVPTLTYSYVTAIEKNNGTSEYALKGGDATTGKLGSYYKGKLPFKQAKEGAIVLGSGGDCCYSNTTMSQGTFYEGAIVAGYASDETDDAVQANIVGAQYGK
jgi:non-reducing end alpha-L-arabinofuranosidase